MKRIGLIILALAALGAASASVDDPSVLASGSWWRVGVKVSGIYRLNSSNLPQLLGHSFDSIAVYGGDGLQLSENNAVTPIDGLQRVPIWVSDANGNGLFDQGDYLLFYGEGVETWRYSVEDQRFEAQVHAYSNSNYYFVTTNSRLAPLRVDTLTVTSSAALDVTTHTVVDWRNSDLVNIFHTGQVWLGEKFTNSVPNRSVSLGLPSAPVAGSSIKCRYAMASVASTPGVFSLRCNGEQVLSTISQNTVYTTVIEQFAHSGGNRVDFDFNYTSTDPMATGYLDYVEINAEVPLTFSSSQTFVRNSQINSSATLRYNISSAPSGLRVWRVDGQVCELPAEVADGVARFVDSAEVAHTYVAFYPNSAFLSPTTVEVVENQDLTSGPSVDYVIVAHPQFLTQAELLAELHRSVDSLTTLVVTPEQVFNEFSSGKQDPMAIRSLLRNMATRDSSRAPRYLLLFGKGTYDHRNILGSTLPTVVTYQTPFSFDEDGRSYCTDDAFGYLGPNEVGTNSETLDVAVGRIPARSDDEANHMVDKILGYVNKRDLTSDNPRGDWRNYVTLLADDADPSSPFDTAFAHSSEYTARLIKARYPHYNIDKIYADSYVQTSGAIGSYYPDVDNALKRRMDYGCLLINYIGHGSTDYIGTERYIELDDISNYANTDKLSFLVTSTCTFGRYDLPDGLCGAEAFLSARGGGVGIISASRPISHTESFNTNVCLMVLNPNFTVGEALRQSKNATPVSHSISLLGDPAMRLSFPNRQVVVTHINDSAVSINNNDSAMVLSRVKISGEIRDDSGIRDDNFDGVIYPLVFDREIKTHTLANDNPGTELAFTQQKSILYKGVDSVRGGRFEYSFIVPRDVAYQYDFGKLSHYARSGSNDASGEYTRLLFGGLDQTVDIVASRPEIRLFINDTNFRTGGITNESPTLFALLADSVGINAVGSGLGHDITATLDGNPNSVVVLNDFYETDLADSRCGSIAYTLKQLSPGLHSVELKAWNIFNYSNTASITFRVRSSDTLVVAEPLCYPNPSTEAVSFSLQVNDPERVAKVVLQIFDMFGQCVALFEPDPDPSSYVIGPLRWNFTSHTGAKLPTGLYVARFLVTTTDGEVMAATTKCVKK